MLIVVQSLLKTLVGENWNVKLLSVATDGAITMTGSFQSTVTTLDRVSTSGFYRIWCIAHQLDLFMQSLMREILSDILYEPMVSFISYLRHQFKLINEMCCKCATVSSTRWHSETKAPEAYFI